MLIGTMTPVVRSFVAIPAGLFEMPLAQFLGLALIGSASGRSPSPASATPSGRATRASTTTSSTSSTRSWPQSSCGGVSGLPSEGYG